MAFKDEYEAIVRQLVNDGVMCQNYEPPSMIEIQPSQPLHTPASKDFVDEVFEKLQGRA